MEENSSIMDMISGFGTLDYNDLGISVYFVPSNIQVSCQVSSNTNVCSLKFRILPFAVFYTQILDDTRAQRNETWAQQYRLRNDNAT